MAYFQQRKSSDQEEYTRQFAAARDDSGADAWDGPVYDDGFDDLEDDMLPEEEYDPEAGLSEEEVLEDRRRKYRIAAGVGDLAGTLIGVGAILALLAFLMSMLQFISSDISQSLSLWQIRF